MPQNRPFSAGPPTHPSGNTPSPGEIIDRVSFTVEHGKIQEFVHASQAHDPIHTSPSMARRRGLRDVAATPTHVVTAGHHRSQSEMLQKLGLNIARVVVGGTGWSYHHPLVAGDELTGVRRLVSDESKRSKSGQELRIITLVTEYRLADGTVAVIQRERLIERG